MHHSRRVLRSGVRPLRQELFTYSAITYACAQQIEQMMGEARRLEGRDAVNRCERAHGIYLAWRTIVMESADPALFARDACAFENVLSPCGK